MDDRPKEIGRNKGPVGAEGREDLPQRRTSGVERGKRSVKGQGRKEGRREGTCVRQS